MPGEYCFCGIRFSFLHLFFGGGGECYVCNQLSIPCYFEHPGLGYSDQRHFCTRIIVCLIENIARRPRSPRETTTVYRTRDLYLARYSINFFTQSPFTSFPSFLSLLYLLDSITQPRGVRRNCNCNLILGLELFVLLHFCFRFHVQEFVNCKISSRTNGIPAIKSKKIKSEPKGKEDNKNSHLSHCPSSSAWRVAWPPRYPWRWT